MNTIHNARQRTSPSHLKKTAARSYRPSTLLPASSSSKLKDKSGKAKVSHEEVFVDEEDDDMATSFLQYCAMCETQIIVPNNSILYCSENCRRKDGQKPLSSEPYLLSYYSTTKMSSTPVDLFDVTTRSIAPRRKPAVFPGFEQIPPTLHNAKSDLDPTEWKPAEPKPQLTSHPSPSSEAFQYLSQFHRTNTTINPLRRPVIQGRSTTSALMMAQTAPSLSHTPTTSMTSSVGSLVGTPYEFAAEDMPPQIMSHSPSTKSVDYVHQVADTDSVPTPIAKTKAPVTSSVSSPILGTLSYKKKWIPNTMDHVSGSLKKLLYLQQMAEAHGSAEM